MYVIKLNLYDYIDFFSFCFVRIRDRPINYVITRGRWSRWFRMITWGGGGYGIFFCFVFDYVIYGRSLSEFTVTFEKILIKVHCLEIIAIWNLESQLGSEKSKLIEMEARVTYHCGIDFTRHPIECCFLGHRYVQRDHFQRILWFNRITNYNLHPLDKTVIL